MSDTAREKLEQLLIQIEHDAGGALSRGELLRLRTYWGDVRQALDVDGTTEPC